MTESKIKELSLHLVSIDYCPCCGKPWFGKSYIESTDTLNDFMHDNEKFPTWNYRCNKCQSEFIIKFRSLLKQEKEK